MSSISSVPGQFPSPLAMLQNELTSEVSAGTISSSDQSALSSALNSIDSQLQSDASSSSGPPSPSNIKSTVDSLIQQQVQSGSLTSSQASELQNLFASTFANGPGGAGGPPPGVAGGPRPGDGFGIGATSSSGSSGETGNLTIAEIILASGTGSSSASTTSSSDTSSSSSSSASSDASSSSNPSSSDSNLLNQFLKLLEQSTGAATGYSADGQSNNTISALILNYQI